MHHPKIQLALNLSTLYMAVCCNAFPCWRVGLDNPFYFKLLFCTALRPLKLCRMAPFLTLMGRGEAHSKAAEAGSCFMLPCGREADKGPFPKFPAVRVDRVL